MGRVDVVDLSPVGYSECLMVGIVMETLEEVVKM